MRTTAQIAASRRNGQRSTGPRTAAGKAISRRNATKRGLRAKLPPQPDPEILKGINEEF